MNVLFFHIPKTAGTFIANWFRRNLNYKIYRYFSENKIKEELNINYVPADAMHQLMQLPRIKNATYTPCFNLEDLNGKDNVFLYAHEFDAQCSELFKNPDWLKITSLRDPIQRIFSSYAQNQRNNVLADFENNQDLYQFFFVYDTFAKLNKDSTLELTKNNAHEIFKKAKDYISIFDIIFETDKVSEQLEKLFYIKPSTEWHSHRENNITSEQMVLNIPYSTIKKLCKFVHYEYEFIRNIS